MLQRFYQENCNAEFYCESEETFNSFEGLQFSQPFRDVQAEKQSHVTVSRKKKIKTLLGRGLAALPSSHALQLQLQRLAWGISVNISLPKYQYFSYSQFSLQETMHSTFLAAACSIVWKRCWHWGVTSVLASGSSFRQGTRTSERLLMIQTYSSNVYFSDKAVLSLVCDYFLGGRKSF